MTCPPRPDMTLSALEAALAGGRLSPSARESARRLIRRLSSPVRVVLVGMPDAGKSQLLNMLAGREVIPTSAAHPTLSLRRGSKIVSHLHFQGGHVESHEGLAPCDALQHRPVRVEIEAPLPILDKVSLTEVVADASVEGQRAAIAEAVENADMILWCTQEFSGPEPVLWNLVPEALKHHSFLVLTKADLLQRRGVLRQRLDELSDLVGESFHGIYPVATEHALAALARGAQDQTGFTGSGGRALVKAIYKHVEQGRQADLDNALLFLSRHAPMDGAPLPEAAVVEPALPPVAESAPRDAAPRAEAPAAQADFETAPDMTAPDAAAEAAVAEQEAWQEDWEDWEDALDASAQADAPAAPDFTARLRAEALAILAEDAQAIPPLSEHPDTAETATVLARCTETLERLTMLCAEADLGACPFAEDVEEAAEMGLLLQIEGSVAAAADAVTLLLQLRRALSA